VALVVAAFLAACSSPIFAPDPPTILARPADDAGATPYALDGAAVTGAVAITVDDQRASGGAAYDEVRYYLDTTPIGGVALATLTVRPFELRIDSRALSNGPHHLSAVATIGGVDTATATASFSVHNEEPVENLAPVVNAGADREGVVGAPLDLAGSVTDDGLPAGQVGVSWSVVTGAAQPSFANPTSAFTTVTFPAAGVYVLRLAASDGAAAASDDVTVEVAPAPPATGPSPDYDHLDQLYVAVGGSDSAPGTIDRPLRTIAEGMRRAVANRKDGRGTRVLLMPGVYRESLVGAYDSSPGPLIVLEAYERHQAVITGAERFTDWSCSGGVCTHPWTYDWGPSPNPWPGSIDIGELALRREMVIVNGENLRQVASSGALTSGSFYVDEGANLLRVAPPSGVDLRTVEVEVAIRPVLLRTQGLSDFVVDGLVFRHAASAFRQAAVDIVDQRDVLLRNARIEWNGQNGLSLKGHRFTVEDVVSSHNGSSGLVGYRVTDTSVTRAEVSFNNWRGARGDYTSWEVGNKFVQAHRLTLTSVRASSNLSRGLWLDSDNADVVLEDVRSCGNLRDGLFVEANQGPITIRNATFCQNEASGLLTSATMRLEITGSTFAGNGHSQVNLSGSFGHSITDWETGEHIDLANRDWSWEDNTFRSAGGGPLIATTYPSSGWATLMSTSTFDYNDYASGTTKTFQVSGGSFQDFAGWKSNTGQDAHSTFALE